MANEKAPAGTGANETSWVENTNKATQNQLYTERLERVQAALDRFLIRTATRGQK